MAAMTCLQRRWKTQRAASDRPNFLQPGGATKGAMCCRQHCCALPAQLSSSFPGLHETSADCHTLLRSHAMETCELDSPVCKPSGAPMLLETEAARTVRHCPSTAMGQSTISQAAFSEDDTEGASQKFSFFYRGAKAAAENKQLSQMLRSSPGLMAALSLFVCNSHMYLLHQHKLSSKSPQVSNLQPAKHPMLLACVPPTRPAAGLLLGSAA